MQAVGPPELAIALARNGSLGFLHRNRSIEEQVEDVVTVKNFEVCFVLFGAAAYNFFNAGRTYDRPAPG